MGFVSLSPMAQQYASFVSLNRKYPKNVLPLPPQYPSAVLVSFPSALRLPKFMGFISLSPLTQQYVNFPTLSLNHPKYVLPPPEIPLNTQVLYWFRFPQLCDSQNVSILPSASFHM